MLTGIAHKRGNRGGESGVYRDVVHYRHLRILTILTIVPVLGALLSCTSGSGTTALRSSPKAADASTGIASVAAHLAAAPADCPASRPLLQPAPPWGEMFGAGPAFGGFYARPDPSSGSFHVGRNTRRSQEGWAVKVLWVLEPKSERVTVSGHEVETGAAMMFDPVNGPLSDTLLLDPAHPGTPDRRKGWTEYPSLVRFPAAGCYIVEASWADGSWQRGFGIGR